MRYQRCIDRTRLWLGFFIAPAVVPVSSVALLIGISQIQSVDCPAGSAVLALAILCIGTPFTYVGAVIFALPYVCIMESRGQLGFWTTILPALALGLASPALLLVSGMAGAAFFAIAIMPGIVLAALCFYFIAVWRSVATPLE